LTVATLVDTPVWDAIIDAWRGGAVLAGSSAGAMALGAWTLIRSRVPGDSERQSRPALGVVPGVAVVPHFEEFGRAWLPSARAALPDAVLVGVDTRTAAVWRGGAWRVHGSGSVRIVAGDGEQGYRRGDQIVGLPDPTAARP
jgi:cyanophycinase